MTDLPAESVQTIESLVVDWLDENDVPGASVVVVDADGERYAEGFGARDIETNDPATPNTLFGMGSISKSVTALGILQLAEAGALSLDDPVDDYVDHYRDAPGEPIRIEDLLCHSSGMPATPTGVFEQSVTGFPAGIADEGDFERFVRGSTEFRDPARERFHYYNAGYDVLGSVVETVSGRPYAEYIESEIFEPLGLDRATFDPERLSDDDDAMTGYKPGGDDEPPEPEEFPLDEFQRPAGGLISSARDLSRFLRAMMSDGSLGGTRVCSPDAVDRLQRGRVVRQTYLDGREEEYGFGWIRHPLENDEVVGHGGSILVSTAYAGYLRDAGLGVVVACNTSANPHAGELGTAILARLSDRPVTAVPAYALKEKCEAVTGTYESYRGELTVSVEPADGGLTVTFEGPMGGPEVTAFPATLDPDDYEFYTVTGAGARAPLEFDLEGEHDDLFFQRTRVRRVSED